MIVLIKGARESGSKVFDIIKEFSDLEDAEKECGLTGFMLKEYLREGHVRIDIDTTDFAYLLNTDTGRPMGAEVRTAIRDYKLNKII